MHFEQGNDVHKTLRRITQKLDELSIPYALVGGMALFFHGLRRFTEDVDILVNRDGLKTIHERLEGRGYMPRLREARISAMRTPAFESSSSSPVTFRETVSQSQSHSQTRHRSELTCKASQFYLCQS
jgi:hypothetical protein